MQPLEIPHSLPRDWAKNLAKTIVSTSILAEHFDLMLAILLAKRLRRDGSPLDIERKPLHRWCLILISDFAEGKINLLAVKVELCVL